MADEKTLADVCEELRGINGTLKATFWVVFFASCVIAGMLLSK